ncbi:MAG: hypothetical protein BMS9Abin05_0088 [Rhodothermia bacterium]|nr:MAG: hypothetical protein BMS9Abin05_0088 [Rhodothermia bacterium]
MASVRVGIVQWILFFGKRNNILFLHTVFLASVISLLQSKSGWAQEVFQSPPISVLSREDLSATGISRLGKLLSTLPGMRSSSIDGFSYRLSILGLSSLDDPAPTIYLDGIPQSFHLLGVSQINLIPTTVSEIESISYSTMSIDEESYRPRSGRIDIRTLQRPGFSIRADISGTNEINDPGPYRYTSRNSPNVDRSGPQLETTVSYRSGVWYSRLLLRSDEHHVTDEKIAARVRSIYNGHDSPRLELSAVDFLVSRLDSAGQHSVRIGASSFGDFLYRRAIGFEIPFRQRWSYFTASGGVELPRQLRLSYYVDRRQSIAGERQNSFPIGVELIRDWTHASLAVQIPSREGHYEVKLGVSQLKYSDRLSERVFEKRNSPSLRISADWRMNATRHLVAVVISSSPLSKYGARSANFAFNWAADWRLRPNVSILFRTGFDQIVQPSAESFEQLLTTAVPIPVFDELFDGFRPLPTSKSTQLHAQIGTRIGIRDNLKVQVLGQVRGIRDGALSRPIVDLSNKSAYVFPEWNFRDGLSGKLVGIITQMVYVPANRTRLVFHHSWVGVVASEEADFEELFTGTLGHRTTASLWLSINPRFRLYSRVEYIPVQAWKGYREKDPALDKPYLLWDITVQKELWDDYLQFSLSGQNITNASYASHPAGGIEYLALQVRLRFRLDVDLQSP